MEKFIEESKLLTVEELAEMLKSKTKAETVNIEYIVNDANSRTVNGQKVVQKHVTINNFVINSDYEKRMQEETKNPDFKAQQPKGKTIISKCLLRSDKTDKLLINGYYDISWTSNIKVLQYYKNGKKITEKTLEKNDLFLDAHYSQKQKSYAMNDAERLKTITIQLENIFKISFNCGTPNFKTYYIL